MSNHGWEPWDVFPKILDHQILVWKVNIPDFYCQQNEFVYFLNDKERNRASHFKFEDQKQRFIICRGILRLILSKYINENPAKLEIQATSDGKPILAEGYHHHNFEFNISHSEAICLIALSRNLKVGVDVEALKPLSNLEEMAQKFLSEKELDAFHSISTERQLATFYNFWSAKEALLKAVGCGLTIEPRQVDILKILEDKKFSAPYQSHGFEIPHVELSALDGINGYVAWLALEGKVEEIRKIYISRQLVSL